MKPVRPSKFRPDQIPVWLKTGLASPHPRQTRALQLILCFAWLALGVGASRAGIEATPILLFNGTGTSPNDVKAVEAVLKVGGHAYATADSARLNAMSEAQLLAYRLLIVPGGNYLSIAKNLTPGAATNIHNAVGGGLNFLGICAGGLLAGNTTANSLNLTSGARVGFYAAVNRGIHKAAVPIAVAGGPVIEHYWEDGPQFTGWGDVVGKYPDGTAAIAEGTSGKGWVILCGVHPEAPEKWRRGMAFTTSASAANAYAGTMVDAALRGARLPHY